MDQMGLDWTKDSPKPLVLLGFQGFVGLAWMRIWWLWVDSNHRPQHYECCALTG